MVLASANVAATRWISDRHPACQRLNSRSAWKDGFVVAAVRNGELPFVRIRRRVWEMRDPVEPIYPIVSRSTLGKFRNCRGQTKNLLRGMECEL